MEKYDIILEHVTKKFSKCTNDLERLLSVFGFKKIPKLTVIDDVSFNIERGEKVALIGKNGSGKSTILKMISNITNPTSGKITVNRRVSTLIEVSAGFQYEFTARENMMTRGILLGLNKKQIKEQEQRIFEFAGIDENFRNQQLKRFSSGMVSKLGFAINLFCSPEILIVDEALAVGDIEFKNKCIKAIKELSKKSDITLLFVSHDQSMVEEFCNRGIFINNGKIVADGKVKEVFKEYNKLFNK